MGEHDDIDHTGLTGIPSLTAPNPTTIELGHASDTTLSRASAGVVAVEGTNLVKAGAATGSGLTMATARLLGRTTASTGAIEEITVGSGLSLAAGSLTATGGSGLTRSTVGTTSAGASFRAPTGTTYLKKITLASAGVIIGISAHVKGDGSNNGGIIAGILSDSAGSPLNVIAGSSVSRDTTSGNLVYGVLLNSTARWINIPIGAYLASGDYWLAVALRAASNGMQLAYDAGTGSDKTQAIDRLSDVSFISTSNTTDDHSIYADVIR